MFSSKSKILDIFLEQSGSKGSEEKIPKKNDDFIGFEVMVQPLIFKH